MNGNSMAKAGENLVAKRALITVGVGDDEKPLSSIRRTSERARANARAFERERRQRDQAKNDRRDDRESNPSDRWWPDHERDDEPIGD
jgi:phage shock protein A